MQVEHTKSVQMPLLDHYPLHKFGLQLFCSEIEHPANEFMPVLLSFLHYKSSRDNNNEMIPTTPKTAYVVFASRG